MVWFGMFRVEILWFGLFSVCIGQLGLRCFGMVWLGFRCNSAFFLLEIRLEMSSYGILRVGM